MNTLLQDLRYGIRSLLKNPGFALIVIAVLALGIGANSAIFSVVNGVLLRPLPYRDADRLVMVWGNFEKLKIERLASKTAEYENYAAQDQVFEEAAAFANQSFNLSGVDEAERVMGARITPNLLPLLGASAAQGRGIASDENQSGRDHVVVLSDAFWQRHFGGRASAVGQSLTLNDETYTIIGVMPPAFQFPHASFRFGEPADVFVPLVYSAAQVAQREGPYYLNVVAKLKSGVALPQAQVAMTALGQKFENEYRGYRGPKGGDGGWHISLAPLQEEAVGGSRRALLLLLGAVALVLLIACANVANLLLVRGAVRQKEIAIRLALGASRFRVVRQLLVESLMLAVLGGAAGLLLAVWGIDLLRLLQPANLPRVQELSVDWRVLVFTLLLTVFTAFVFGLVPAWQASKINLQGTLKDDRSGSIGKWRRHHWRNALLVGEVALSLVLLVGAGLLVNSFRRLQQVKPALATSQIMTAGIELPDSHYGEPAQVSGFYQQLLEKVQSLPGVQSATLSTIRPLSGVTINDPLAIEGRPLDPSNISFAGWQVVGANFFQTLGIPLVRGRDLTVQDMDMAAPPVAVINETMAQRYWPAEDPIGKRLTVGLARPGNPAATIVGVAKDLPQRLDSRAQADWYLSRPAAPPQNQILFVRTAGDPAALASSIRSVVASIDRNQPVANIKTMSDVVADTVAPRKFNMALLTLFAGIALALAALGIYGVVAYSVAQRTHEVGIRMALGAQKSDVLGLLIKNGMLLTLIGVAIGVLIALQVTRLMTALLFEVKPTDTTTFVAVSTLFVLIAFIACYVPARRATKIDPLVALRYE
jgi:putative ABC transport system permease protein